MSDFNNDPVNRERDLRVVEREDSGMGMMAGIAVIVLLLLGGLVFYFNPGNVRTAENKINTISSPAISTPDRTPMTPSASPTTPAPAAPSSAQ